MFSKLANITLLTIARASAVAMATIMAATTLIVLPRNSAATPVFAQQTGLPCGQCHESPAGGGKLKGIRPKVPGKRQQVARQMNAVRQATETFRPILAGRFVPGYIDLMAKLNHRQRAPPDTRRNSPMSAPQSNLSTLQRTA
ncbi:MAG: hypothetical protein WBF03_00730 [Xanthobacteraceae bacterium]